MAFFTPETSKHQLNMKHLLTLMALLALTLTGFGAAVDKPYSGLRTFTGIPETNALWAIMRPADTTQSTNGSTVAMTYSNLVYGLRTGYPTMTLTNIANGTGTNVLATNVLMYPAPGDNYTLRLLDAAGVGQVTYDASGNYFMAMTSNIAGPVTNTGPIVSSGKNAWSGSNYFSTPPVGIGVRRIGQSPTNIYLASLSTTSSATLTNNGGWSSGTYVARITCQPLVSPNAKVYLTLTGFPTNANTTAGSLYFYLGSNTNYIGSLQSGLSATDKSRNNFGLGSALFFNLGSYTNQAIGGAISASTASFQILGMTNFVNTSAAFDLYVSAATVTSYTNYICTTIDVIAVE
jgi:hypothetical protein